MEKTFFYLLPNGYDKYSGLLYAPEGRKNPIASDGKPVENWQTLELTLRDGFYCDFSRCVSGANIVSEEFKEVIEKFIPKDYPLEFLPVKAKSEKYGDRRFYIMHFTKIFDVIDKGHTVYLEGTDVIVKECLDFQKCKDLHIFNVKPATNGVVVSGEVRRELRKAKLDLGFVFHPIPYFDPLSK